MPFDLIMAAAEQSGHMELPVSKWFFGLGFLASFLTLLGITFMFRATGSKH